MWKQRKRALVDRLPRLVHFLFQSLRIGILRDVEPDDGSRRCGGVLEHPGRSIKLRIGILRDVELTSPQACRKSVDQGRFHQTQNPDSEGCETISDRTRMSGRWIECSTNLRIPILRDVKPLDATGGGGEVMGMVPSNSESRF